MKGYEVGQVDKRPWGVWEVIGVGDGYVVKRIIVNVGEKFSLQYHNFRSENWIIVSGSGLLSLGDDAASVQVEPIYTGQSVFIPTRRLHRLEAVGQQPLMFIEVQHGEILREDDIVRVHDDYNRLIS